MFKNNLNKVLLIIVLIIWGLLIYKVIKPKSKVSQIIEQKEHLSPKKNFTRDTFVLAPTSRDPFLGKILINSKKTTHSIKKISKNKRIIIEQKPWPRIEYLGYVKKKGNTIPLLVLRIDGKLYRKKLHNKIDGVYLNQLIEDTLIVSYLKEKRFIAKQK